MPPQDVNLHKRNRSSSPNDKEDRKKLKPCYLALELLVDFGLQEDFYKSGKAAVRALNTFDPAFSNIYRYVKRSHLQCQAKVLSIFRIQTNWDNSPKDHNTNPKNKGAFRMMLWHGTSKTNVPKILEEGLVLPKKNLGSFFGHGIYFSDNFSYSLNYCGRTAAPGKTEVLYLLLSDVLLGDMHETYDLLPDAPKVKVKVPGQTEWKEITVDSVKGKGWRVPDPQGDLLINGTTWPLGKKVYDTVALEKSQLDGNEFIVYEAHRVIPQYLVKVETTDVTDWSK